MKLSALFVFCSLTLTLSAQKIHLGPEVGSNIIHIEKTDLGKDFQPGWFTGIAFEYDFYDFFAIKSGVYYSQKRQSYSSADTSQSPLIGLLFNTLGDFEIPYVDFNTYSKTEGRTTQNYIEIPVLAQYKFKGLSTYFGPYFGFMFGARNKEITYVNSPFTQAIDISSLDSSGFLSSLLPAAESESSSENSDKTNLRVFDLGIRAGIGYENNNIGIHASYNYGFPDYRLDRGKSPKQNHQYFQISVNYLFGIGKKAMGSSRL